MRPADLLLLVGCGAAAALVALLAAWLIPDRLPERPAYGVRASRRREALAASSLFRLVEPAIRAVAHHAHRLPLEGYRRRTAQLIVQAGEPLGLSGDEFLGVCALGGAAGAAVGLMVVGDLGPAVLPVLATIGAYYPNVWLESQSDTRLIRISRGLPAANDLLVLAMEAGSDFLGAIRHVVGKVRESRDPLVQEFTRILHDVELGATRRAALEAFAERAPTEPVRGFVTAVIQAEQRGTPVAAALRIQSGALRAHRSLLVEKLANRAAVLILLPLVFIFVATVLLLFGGIIVRAMRGELM